MAVSTLAFQMKMTFNISVVLSRHPNANYEDEVRDMYRQAMWYQNRG